MPWLAYTPWLLLPCPEALPLSRRLQVEEKKDAAAVKEAKKPEPKKEMTKEEKEKVKKAAEKVLDSSMEE